MTEMEIECMRTSVFFPLHFGQEICTIMSHLCKTFKSFEIFKTNAYSFLNRERGAVVNAIALLNAFVIKIVTYAVVVADSGLW